MSNKIKHLFRFSDINKLSERDRKLLLVIHLNNGTCIHEVLNENDAEKVLDTIFLMSDKALIRIQKSNGKNHVVKVGCIVSAKTIPVRNILDINKYLEYEMDMSS
ncbi:hypothetical protein ACFPVV_07120 [Macrococcoides bohemicum]|uniref:Uncharacterized protein n=1 Tax=Macrococcoides bohemicum TaxID=1903056 RepID=A0A327ZZY6_9STAP|nr:hypothetical protein [Macrococcus bohemicus]RAK47647.1 hypothetical protein BHX94_12375 [Macrococcus bohemicus]